MLWNAVIFGPDDILWDGGTFKLTLQFTEDYPNKPPTVALCFSDVSSKHLCRWNAIVPWQLVAQKVDGSLVDKRPDVRPETHSKRSTFVNRIS
ncbi:hypothetical protein KIW84_021313 [Lathyrus oleraceus]|uniref:UBC core domain-containing protein n=1 Tax=Pisum sativum TaxID=3888 RepID=A0A9D5B9S9_PEA|nr:hypothetical protein KIW84_021313 [Pisum sativum]